MEFRDTLATECVRKLYYSVCVKGGLKKITALS
jgi:hypothetical protein